MSQCQLPTYEVLSPAQIQKINENSYVIPYRKGEVICNENHPVSQALFLKTGLVKLHKEHSRDRSTIMGIVGPDNFIGLMSVFYGKLYQNAMTAIEDCEVVQTSLDVFFEVISKNGRYAMQLLHQISGYGFNMIEKMFRNMHKQIPGRLAELLLIFSKDIYKSYSFSLPLSRQEIADFISSTKETVSRTLTEFKNDRLIDVNDKFITIKSPGLIQKLSEIG